jgi:DNA-binding PadR family transcriptional regulator
VLGVVKLFQPVHGYEVRRELLSWRAQDWASVQPGSIYNALKTLCRDGLVEVASTDQVGGRPERTTYRLTAAGDEEFHTLLREEWWTVRPPIDPLMAAVSFLGDIARPEAIAALEHRAVAIRGMVRQLDFAIEAHDGSDSPYHVREMMRLMNARVSSELVWSEQLIERLRRNEYTTAGDPPWQPRRRVAPAEATAIAGPRRTSPGLRGEPEPAAPPARSSGSRGRKPRGSRGNGMPDTAASSSVPRSRGRGSRRGPKPGNDPAASSTAQRSAATRAGDGSRNRGRDRTPSNGQAARSEGWRRDRDSWHDRRASNGSPSPPRGAGDPSSSAADRGSRRRRRASR